MDDLAVRRLSELETTIERGLKTFVEVGNALAEIRDSRLYRESYATFEDYCRERWGMSKRHAVSCIAAAVNQNWDQLVTNYPPNRIGKPAPSPPFPQSNK
jgi:hypothetical protein